MTAGQSAGQLRRTDRSGTYVVIAAVAAGALAIGAFATLSASHQATPPATAPVPVIQDRIQDQGGSLPLAAPVPVIQDRIQDQGGSLPLAVPAPSIQFLLEEHGQTVLVNADAWARAQMATATSAALPAPSIQRQFQLHERSHAVSVNPEGSTTTWPKGR